MNQQQQLIQRMQQQQQQQSQQASGGMGTPTPPRQFPGSQGTPNPTVPAQQGQFGTPSNPQAAAQSQTPTQAPPSANSVTTPQTPTFPMTGQGAVNGNSTPLSPNSQAKGQERISLLLEINQELLFEAINLRHNLEEVKREAASSAAPEQQKERKEEEEAFAHDWAQYVVSSKPVSVVNVKWLIVITGFVGGCRLTLPTWPHSRTGSNHRNMHQPTSLHRPLR